MNNCCMLTNVTNLLRESGNCVFLCFASFEERCLSIPQKITDNPFKQVIIFQFKDFKVVTNSNLDKLYYLLQNSKTVELDNSKPMISVDIFSQLLAGFKEKKIKNLIIDISCFNREVLLIFLHLLFLVRNSFDSIKFVYNSAKEMTTNLSFGLLDIRSVFGYGGLASPLQKDHMIVLLGFEHERARQIIDTYEPSLVTIAIGDKNFSINEDLFKKNQDALASFSKFIDQISAEVQEAYIPVTSPLETMRSLQTLVSNNLKYNTIIVPLNTKLSTIGAGLVAIKDSSVQICYSQMASYNFSHYSIPSEDFYSCDIATLFKT